MFKDWLLNLIVWDMFNEEELVETPKEVYEEVIWSGSCGGTGQEYSQPAGQLSALKGKST